VDYVCNPAGNGFDLVGGAGGNGGSPVHVNSVQVNNPNLNDTTPAAGVGYVNCKWNVSSSNIALECPAGTTSSSFARGDDSRIVNAVPNSRTVSAGAGLTGGGDLTANRTISANVGTTTGTLAAGDDSRIVNAVPNSRTVSAGAGLTGGGDLTANRTISANVGTTTGTLAAGDDSRIVNALQPGASLSNTVTGVTPVSGPYFIGASDFGKVVVFSNTSPLLITLLNPALSNLGKYFWVVANGSSLIQLTRTGGQTWTIDGVSSVLLYPSQSVMVYSDGTSWFTFRGKSGNGDPALESYLGPTVSFGEWDATQCADGEIPKKISGAWACGTDTGGGSGGSVNINGVSVNTPNFNAATPAAQTGFINVQFQTSSASVSAEVPYGTTSSTFSRGDHLHAGVYEPSNGNIQAHIANTSNPHAVTKSQVGLGNVDNTSDANKPISTLQQAALNLKADDASVVHNTGDETVGGIKTLTNGMKIGSGIPNDTTTGTANKLLAKFTSAGKLVKLATTDTAVATFIVASGAGTSGSAFVCTSGQCTCTFDAAAAAQHYVIASSTTAGNCHDAGASLPTDVWIIGQVNATIGGAGDGVVNVLSGFVKSSGGSAGCSPGSPAKLDAGTAGACQYDATYFYFASSTNFWQRIAWDTRLHSAHRGHTNAFA
jgi:hypothetical protein